MGSGPWFGPKRIGWGLGPRTWQGWAVTVGGAALVIVLARALGS
ncbi:hypothetical protein BKA22_001623 [Cellulomonas soli]|nr:hypothetical protein [Cellulomonas soli]